MLTCSFQEFYKDLGRPDMYIKYIYKLVELHVLCNNYTEAGFTLQLHASLMDVNILFQFYPGEIFYLD